MGPKLLELNQLIS